MVFKRLLGSFGVGAPSVDTVVADPRVRPGGVVRGEVRLQGGDFDAELESIVLALVTRADAEHGEGAQRGLIELLRTEVSGPFRLGAGEQRALPFEFPVPWETPITEVWGQPLYGTATGVRTELAIARAVDRGDLDPLRIEPLPAQDAVLQALSRLGFRLKGAELESGTPYGVDRYLPFHQEIEFYPPAGFAHLVEDVELVFVADPGGLTVLLEADGRGPADDSVGHWRMTHDEARQRDWTAEIIGWFTAMGGHRDPYGPPGGHAHPDAYVHDPHQTGHHGGPGMGTVIAAGAAGAVGGFLAAEAIDEILEGEED